MTIVKNMTEADLLYDVAEQLHIWIIRHFHYLQSYIQKAEVLEVRTPQIILIFRKVIVWERENYQICSVEFCQEKQ